MDFSDGAVDAIIQRAHGYPYFLQEWGYQVRNAAATSLVDRALVDEVTPRVVRHLTGTSSSSASTD